ncbi:MAG: hypothetical protein JRH01_13740 [Deltaproteobacteria bacterium]|nr:hypothetical protein [Deltaproteobacteria bacterium]MBW2394944.1 hypothetical protein [Deltaproteobacteria bacterium]
MTLEDLGNIGEFVGAIGVVVTLIYLALQIRENTNSILGSVEREDARGSSDFLQSLAENPQLARVWRLGLSEPAKLTQDEGTQFVMLMGTAFYRLEGPFKQYKRGLLSEEAWEPWGRLIARYMRSPAVLTWWSRGDVPFSRSFVEYVNAMVPTSSRRGNDSPEETLAPVWPNADESTDQ